MLLTANAPHLCNICNATKTTKYVRLGMGSRLYVCPECVVNIRQLRSN